MANIIRGVGSERIINSVSNPKIINSSKPSFSDILKSRATKSEELSFSKHATERLMSRNISLNHSEMERLKQGLDRASQKGVKDALVLLDNKAFVVSVKNRTIITASTNEQLKENIFTNIDGAVIV